MEWILLGKSLMCISKRTGPMSTYDILFRDLVRSCVVSINLVSIESLLRKPCCLSDKTECWSRWSIMLE